MLSRVGLIAGIGVTVALGFIYGASEWILNRPHEAPLARLSVSSPSNLVEGERMARIVGCLLGCHGDEGEGGVEQIEGIRKVTAPTLSSVLKQYSDEELVRLVRYGVKRDNRSAVGMNSFSLWALADDDLKNIIARLRQLPESPPVKREKRFGLVSRIKLIRGEWQVSADQVDRNAPRWSLRPQTTPFERGRYLASVVCSECHGLDLRGNALEGGPALAIIAAYDLNQFRDFTGTAISVSGRMIDKMSWLPEIPLQDDEVADLYVYLRKYFGFEKDGLKGTGYNDR